VSLAAEIVTRTERSWPRLPTRSLGPDMPPASSIRVRVISNFRTGPRAQPALGCARRSADGATAAL